MIIFVDVDGVCADLLPEWLASYNKDYKDNLKQDAITEWDLTKFVKKECGNKIYSYLEYPFLYNDVKPIEGARSAIEKIRSEGHRVIFATSSTNGASGRKLTWLIDHGFIDQTKMVGSSCHDYIEIHDKSLLRGDILIDDGFHNIEKFNGLGILFSTHHNLGSDWPIRVRGWTEACDYIVNSKILPPGTHPTELKCPEQTREFKSIIDKMYTTHLRKNQDYSPANILATGKHGLITRLWDKVARFSNLNGREVIIDEQSVVEYLFENMKRIMWMSGIYVKMRLHDFTIRKEPQNEPIIDSLIDQAVYSVIGLLVWAKKWGR